MVGNRIHPLHGSSSGFTSWGVGKAQIAAGTKASWIHPASLSGKKKELIFLQGCNSHFYNHFVKFLVLSLGSGNSRVLNQAWPPGGMGPTPCGSLRVCWEREQHIAAHLGWGCLWPLIIQHVTLQRNWINRGSPQMSFPSPLRPWEGQQVVRCLFRDKHHKPGCVTHVNDVIGLNEVFDEASEVLPFILSSFDTHQSFVLPFRPRGIVRKCAAGLKQPRRFLLMEMGWRD